FTDVQKAVNGADAIYTDVWASMGQESEAAQRRQIFGGYQVNDRLFANAAPHAIFMHCLPAHRGEEVTDAVIDSPRSVVFDQAENRLHVQKEVLTDPRCPALAARPVYEHKYLLGTSLARPVIARQQVEVPLEQNGTAVAHRCTGKRNDQVRFEHAYQALAPQLKVIAP